MIAQTSTAASIGNLAGYLSHGKAANNNRVEDRKERVAWESGRNLRRTETIEEAKGQFRRAAARKARQVEKPYYQVILSWQSGNEENGIPPDDPTREEMEEAVDRALSELGLEEHQAWIVAHRDTSTPHVHVAVNRIHRHTGETWSPSYDQTTLYHTLREIEEEKGWHRPGPMKIEDLSEGRRKGLEYWEKQAEKFGRDRSVRRWAREEGIPGLLKQAESWEQAERMLLGTGAALKPRRERGMVIERDGGHVALSSIDPEISRPKLEERYGQSWDAHAQEREGPVEQLLEDPPSQGGGQPEEHRPEDWSEEKLKVCRLAERIGAMREAEQTSEASGSRAGRPAGGSLAGGSPAGEDSAEEGLTGLSTQEKRTRAALVAALGRLQDSPQDNLQGSLHDSLQDSPEGQQGGLTDLEDRLSGVGAAVLRVASGKVRNRRGDRWSRGVELTEKQRKALREAEGIRRREEDFLGASNQQYEDLRTTLDQLREEDVRELEAVLELREQILGSVQGSEARQPACRRREILREEQDVVSSRLPKEALTDQQRKVLDRLDSLGEEKRKTPLDYGDQTSLRDRIEQKERWLKRDLKKLSAEDMDTLRGHLKAGDRRLQELEKHRRAALQDQADEIATDTVKRVGELLEDGKRVRAARTFTEAKARIQNIREQLREQADDGGDTGEQKSRVPEAPESERLESNSLRSRLEESLTRKELSRFDLAATEATVADKRAERGMQEAFEALGDSQKKAVHLCEMAARLNRTDLRSQHLKEAARLLAEMNANQQKEVGRVIGEKGNEMLENASNMAQQENRQGREQGRARGGRSQGGRSQGGKSRGGGGRRR